MRHSLYSYYFCSNDSNRWVKSEMNLLLSFHENKKDKEYLHIFVFTNRYSLVTLQFQMNSEINIVIFICLRNITIRRACREISYGL